MRSCGVSRSWLGGWSRIPHSVGKGGPRTLTKSLAHGLGQYGITVNDVSAGFTETIRDMETHPEVTPGADEGVHPGHPHPARADSEELASASAVLCSTAITRAVIHFNGEWMFG
jgi:3-oxoacyl-[acyl-carrier protein] reductase